MSQIVFRLALYISYLFFFFKQKTAYEMRISDWSSDVCSSDLRPRGVARERMGGAPTVGDRGTRDNSRHGEASDQPIQHGAFAAVEMIGQIGRASCRERVCQYV